MNEFTPEEMFAASFGVGFAIFMFAIVLLIVVSMWKIFEKAGKPGWAALIPIYSGLVLLDIVGKPRWWFILFFVPIANYVFGIWTYNMLSKSFGKDEGFTVGLILLGIVFIPILGFGSAEYQGPYGLGPDHVNSNASQGENILDSDF